SEPEPPDLSDESVAGRTSAGPPARRCGVCYMPNAAIAWKQPNGFYYPPAFHSTNLFFKNVEFRHFVIEPLFQPAPSPPTRSRPRNVTAPGTTQCSPGSPISIGRPSSTTMTAP